MSYSGTPQANTADTPWLLFVGILLLALVPAVMSQNRLQTIEDHLVAELGKHGAKIEQHSSFIEHHQQRALPQLSRQIQSLAAMKPLLDRASSDMGQTSAQMAEVTKAIELLERDLPAQLAKNEQRIDTLEAAVKVGVTSSDIDALRKELASAANLEQLAANLSKALVEVGRQAEVREQAADDVRKQIISVLRGKGRLFATRQELAAFSEANQTVQARLAVQAKTIATLQKALAAKEASSRARAVKNAAAIKALKAQVAALTKGKKSAEDGQ